MRNPIVTLIVGLVIGLIIAAGAFFGGMNVGQAQAQNQTQQFFASRGGGTGANGGTGAGQFGGGTGANGGGGGAGQFGGRGNGNFATGTISKVDGKTITLTVPNASDITVTLVDTATIVKSVVGTPADLQVGDRVVVTGQRSGNNIAATGVQLSNIPGGAGFFPGGGGRGRNGAEMTPTP